MGASVSSCKARVWKGCKGSTSKAVGSCGAACGELCRTPDTVLLPSYNPSLEDLECAICKELLYKPVVNVCGHTFCFWCLHEAMGPGFSVAASCPLCRKAFTHMSRVAEVLHYFLARVYPEEYKAREEETKAEEVKRKMFAPEPVGLPWREALHKACTRQTGETADKIGGVEVGQSCVSAVREAQAEPSKQMTEVLHSSAGCKGRLSSFSKGRCLGLETILDGNGTGLMEPCCGEAQKNARRLTLQDFQCIACHQLLHQPVVLNCGHAYCLPCLEDRYKPGEVSCAFCLKDHPEEGLAICILLEDLVQKLFPATYRHRKGVEAGKQKGKNGNKRRRSRTPPPKRGSVEEGRDGFVHFGIECDGCGVYPIVGQRFQCRDCQEEIGFDLCGSCYRNRQVPVRGPYLFNQRHTINHRMVEVPQTPTFLHEVLGAHPELSVNTVLSMFVAMAEELSEPPRPISEEMLEEGASSDDEAMPDLDEGMAEAPESPLVNSQDDGHSPEGGEVGGVDEGEGGVGGDRSHTC